MLADRAGLRVAIVLRDADSAQELDAHVIAATGHGLRAAAASPAEPDRYDEPTAVQKPCGFFRLRSWLSARNGHAP